MSRNSLHPIQLHAAMQMPTRRLHVGEEVEDVEQDALGRAYRRLRVKT